MHETAIVVLVPEAEAVVGDWRRTHTEDGRNGMVAHVTLLYPFVDDSVLDEHVARARAALSDVEPFDCTLSATGSFPGEGVVYLRPEPDEIFRAMTASLARAFPAYPPYGGVYDDVVPHLTVAQSDDADLLRAIEREARTLLPIRSHVAAASLMRFVDGSGWREHTSVPLG
jgi:2'-5' RNA ligase